jgi:hypothetical protein
MLNTNFYRHTNKEYEIWNIKDITAIVPDEVSKIGNENC